MAETNDSATQPSGSRRLITVFGGTGFLGRRIVKRLLQRDFEVRAVSRHLEQPASLFRAGSVGLMRGDVHNESAVVAALEGAYGVVNAVSLYVEHGQNTFRSVHIDAAARIARVVRETGIEHLAHVSGIGADAQSPSAYISARGRGEQAVQRALPTATLIRPSVMFGPDDAFLTRLVQMVRLLPVCPMFGDGETKLQAVYVEDVAEAVTRLMLSTAGLSRPCYEFGGPQVYSYKGLLQRVARHIGREPWLMPVPFALWHTVASIAEYVPGAPLTRDQIALMQNDNVAAGQFPGLRELGIEATAIDTTLQEIAPGQRHRTSSP